MRPKDRPFLVGRLPVLVQDPGGNADLADVVQQRRPPQKVAVVLRQLQLRGDHITQRTDLLGVTAGLAVVPVQGIDELKRLQGGGLRVGGEPFAFELLEHTLSPTCVAHPQGHLHAVRCFVREREVQLTQRRQRDDSLHQPGDAVRDEDGDGEHRDHPSDPGRQRPSMALDETSGDVRQRDRACDRREERHDADRERQHRTTAPGRAVRILLRLRLHGRARDEFGPRASVHPSSSEERTRR